MPFPATMAEMVEQGYVFAGRGACRGCGRPVEWWRTPTGKRMIMDPMQDREATAITHWATCAKADQFHARRKAGTAKHL
jgi:hypothetical protein